MASEIKSTPKRGRGRPPAFERATALRVAMKLFWERGYEGASFDDLMGAMGINSSSFYNSFGNKERLYREATDAYLVESGEWFMGALGGDTDTKTTFARLFRTIAEQYTRSDLPSGCMISLAATHVPPPLNPLRDMMTQHRATSEAAFATRLRLGIEAGDVSPDTNIDALAAFYSAVARGMAVQARDGASRQRLLEIAELALRAWPASPSR